MYVSSIIVSVLLVTKIVAEDTAFNNNNNDININENDNVLKKRVAAMGFQGTRGKKDANNFDDDEFSKRAAMGFQVKIFNYLLIKLIIN